MTKQRAAVNVGIDVGKAQLDVCLLERGLMMQVANEERTIRALVSRLSRYRLARIVIEATGRLEQPFVRAALAKGLPVVVLSPLKIRRYAGAIG
jgi:transposase